MGVSTNSENIFLKDGGEMGHRVRNYNWAETILGEPHTWPDSLTTSVNIVLGCSFPMLLWWGGELIQFYNDAFRPSLGTDGKHPDSLGKPAPPYWTENWHIIKPLIDQVMDEGKTVFYEDLPIPNFRNGHIEEVYWTFSYSPVLQDGKPAAVLMICMETTETVLSRKRLVKNEALLQSAIDIAELGIWSVDLTTGEMHLSEQHLRMFGITEVSTFDDAIQCIVHQDRERVLKLFNKAQQKEYDGIYDAVFTVQDAITGKHKIIHSVGQAMFDDSGKAIYISGSAQDITIQKNLQLTLEGDVQQRTEELAAAVEELRATNEDLETSNTDLLQSNEQLSQYAYVASHDLQEPLRKIQLFSKMLRDRDTTDEYTKSLIIKIIKSSERMRLLIKDLLDFSRLANPAQKAPVNLNTVIKNVIDDFELVINEKKAVITVADMPQVTAVPLHMNQLFYNLIGNALKFTREGVIPQITITCDLQPANSINSKKVPYAATNGYYNIQITDNGIGIEEQYIKQVFEIFKRLHSTDIYPGSGIGLAICRRIVKNNGGQLFLESEPGEGSTFHVILPV